MSTQRNLREGNSISARVQRRPLLFVLIALCLLFVASYTSRLAEYRRLQIEKDTVQVQIVDAEAKGRELAAELGYVKSPEYVEEIAVTKLGMAHDGDQVLTIIDAPAVPPSDVEAVTADAESRGDESVEPLLTVDEPSIWRQWISVFTPESN